MYLLKLLFVMLFFMGSVVRAEHDHSALTENIEMSLSGDLTGEVGFVPDSGAMNRLVPRELELGFSAFLGESIDAVASISAHMDDDGANVGLHELYLGSHVLVPGSFRFGQYFLGVGQLNKTHRHEWPFVSAPKVFREIFDGRDSMYAEGVLDSGLEYSYEFSKFIVTAGLTSGWTFGHTHDAGTRPLAPTHYVRAGVNQTLLGATDSSFGLNYLGRNDSVGIRTIIAGADFRSRWSGRTELDFLLQAEYWLKTSYRRAGGGVSEQTHGFYIYGQTALTNDLYAGLRFDFYSVLNHPLVNYDLNFVPTIAYQPNPATTLRLAYNIKPSYLQTVGTDTSHYLELQGVFAIGGAHDHAH